MKRIISCTFAVLMTVIFAFSAFASEEISTPLPYSEYVPILSVYPNRNSVDIFSDYFTGLRYEVDDYTGGGKKSAAAVEYQSRVTLIYSNKAEKITVYGYVNDDRFFEQTINLNLLPTVVFTKGDSDNPNHVAYAIDNVVSPVKIVMGGCSEPKTLLVSERTESSYVCSWTAWNAKATITLTPQVAIVYTFEGDGVYTPESRIHFTVDYDGNDIIGYQKGAPAVSGSSWHLHGYTDNTSYLQTRDQMQTLSQVAYNNATGEFASDIYLYPGDNEITVIFFGTNNDHQTHSFHVYCVDEENPLDSPTTAPKSESKAETQTPSGTTAPDNTDKKQNSGRTVMITCIVCIVIIAGAFLLAKLRREK